MITVKGTAKLRVRFSIDLNMTEEEFDRLSERRQNQLIDEQTDWIDACINCELDDVDIDYIKEKDGELE